MVGVAGKSKGCGTCRKRRVKCDEAKPQCNRCVRAKVDCSGYERYPVFITRTQKGFVKRAPLEEIKQVKHHAVDKQAITSLPSPELEATRIVSWFWQSFSRSPPSKYALQSPSHWLDHFDNWPLLLLPLRQAFLAVAVARLAKSTQRYDVLQAGRRIYTQSLASQQKALSHPAILVRDDILAASCVMVMYELFDPSDNKLDAWLEHLSGVSRVLQRRGPHMHDSTASRAILEHSRYLMMFQHLNARKACFLSEEDWLTVPWQGHEKSAEQSVFDNGLKLAGVFESCDAAEIGEIDKADLEALLMLCLAVFRDTDRLLKDSILPCIDYDLVGGHGSSDDSLVVRNPAALLLSITAFAIKLGACESVCQLIALVGEQALRDVCFLQGDTEGQMLPELFTMVNSCIAIASQIVASVELCVTKSVGSMGSARMMFALRTALRQFDPLSSEYKQGKDMLLQLKGKDNRFAALIRAETVSSGRALTASATGLVSGNAAAIAERWDRYASLPYRSAAVSCTRSSGRIESPDELTATVMSGLLAADKQLEWCDSTRSAVVHS